MRLKLHEIVYSSQFKKCNCNSTHSYNRKTWVDIPSYIDFHSPTQVFYFIFCEIFIAWKVSKYGVVSGPYFFAFGLNTEILRKILSWLNVKSLSQEKILNKILEYCSLEMNLRCQSATLIIMFSESIPFKTLISRSKKTRNGAHFSNRG